MAKQKLPYEIVTKEYRYEAAVVVEGSNMVEVSFELNSDTLEPREIKYRLLTRLDDPLARWIGQSNVEHYVSKDGIDAAIRTIAKMVQKRKGFINKAKRHPAYKTMKSVVRLHVKHYHADFYTHDCMAIGQDFSKKFIWMVRRTGTHILFNHSAWNDAIVENESNSNESIEMFYFDGDKLRGFERGRLKFYYGSLS